MLEETNKQASKRTLPDDVDLADDDDDDDDWTARGRAKKRARGGQKKASRAQVLLRGENNVVCIVWKLESRIGS